MINLRKISITRFISNGTTLKNFGIKLLKRSLNLLLFSLKVRLMKIPSNTRVKPKMDFEVKTPGVEAFLLKKSYKTDWLTKMAVRKWRIQKPSCRQTVIILIKTVEQSMTQSSLIPLRSMTNFSAGKWLSKVKTYKAIKRGICIERWG